MVTGPGGANCSRAPRKPRAGTAPRASNERPRKRSLRARSADGGSMTRVSAATVAIRLAETTEDRETAFRFRYQVYCELQQLFVDIADHDRRWLHDLDDSNALIWL